MVVVVVGVVKVKVEVELEVVEVKVKEEDPPQVGCEPRPRRVARPPPIRAP